MTFIIVGCFVSVLQFRKEEYYTSKMSSKPPKQSLTQQTTISVSKVSSLLRASSLEFERIYNRHMHLKAKLEEKHRRMQIQKSQDQRMNYIMLQKERMKASLALFNDDSGRALQDQTSCNNELRQKREQSIKASQDEKFQRNQDRALIIRQQMKELHIKKKLTKQNQEVQSYMRRKDIYQEYLEAIESRQKKNQWYRQSIQQQNRKDIDRMLGRKRELDGLAKKIKKKEMVLRKKLNTIQHKE